MIEARRCKHSNSVVLGTKTLTQKVFLKPSGGQNSLYFTITKGEGPNGTSVIFDYGPGKNPSKRRKSTYHSKNFSSLQIVFFHDDDSIDRIHTIQVIDKISFAEIDRDFTYKTYYDSVKYFHTKKVKLRNSFSYRSNIVIPLGVVFLKTFRVAMK